ncbi:hypothetical protein DSO57_1005753 [Entomophthora muscae]|uniref:Uncharacterized protein n=1 Tax=Entomophthora muscae TaxID=34485 RepID=A0ACC2U658_9FUNG|nr:hypothetical protein DSO57_1005753 [Entomophthora muscae]
MARIIYRGIYRAVAVVCNVCLSLGDLKYTAQPSWNVTSDLILLAIDPIVIDLRDVAARSSSHHSLDSDRQVLSLHSHRASSCTQS